MTTGKEMPFPLSIGFTSSDMSKTLAFYREKLGFTLRECWPDENNPMWMSLVLDKQNLMFGQAMTTEMCAGMNEKNPAAAKFYGKLADAFAKQAHGVGTNTYVMVPDIDAYAKRIEKKGVKLELQPTTQFYGLRDIVVTDPDGYVLTFYTPVMMSSCQSCGMPLTDAQPGQMYCQYCADEHGHLKPYELILEGTVSGYFMAMQKLPRKDAEKAAREHLAKMPAWSAHK